MKRWLRQLMAKIVVAHHEQWGGMLHNYDNGRWKLLTTWNGYDDAGSLEMIQNMLNQSRDNIYISTCKVGTKDGYFVVVDSNNGLYYRAFFHGIYEADEALKDVATRCRKIADKMGFRRPENTEGVKS